MIQDQIFATVIIIVVGLLICFYCSKATNEKLGGRGGAINYKMLFCIALAVLVLALAVVWVLPAKLI